MYNVHICVYTSFYQARLEARGSLPPPLAGNSLQLTVEATPFEDGGPNYLSNFPLKKWVRANFWPGGNNFVLARRANTKLFDIIFIWTKHPHMRNDVIFFFWGGAKVISPL